MLDNLSNANDFDLHTALALDTASAEAPATDTSFEGRHLSAEYDPDYDCTEISGDTYPVKDALRGMDGARWTGSAWIVDGHKVAHVRNADAQWNGGRTTLNRRIARALRDPMRDECAWVGSLWPCVVGTVTPAGACAEIAAPAAVASKHAVSLAPIVRIAAQGAARAVRSARARKAAETRRLNRAVREALGSIAFGGTQGRRALCIARASHAREAARAARAAGDFEAAAVADEKRRRELTEARRELHIMQSLYFDSMAKAGFDAATAAAAAPRLFTEDPELDPDPDPEPELKAQEEQEAQEAQEVQEAQARRVDAYEDRVRYLEQRYVNAAAAIGKRPTLAQQAREALAWSDLVAARAALRAARGAA